MGKNWSFIWKVFKKFKLDRDFFSKEQLNSLGKLVYLGFVEVQSVEIVFVTYADRAFENLKKEIQILQR